ncbi:MAG: hypothetical protein IMZ66_01985 [Planctomycetes bacterium]|nr:hypothetical protein [Planctomycetota bacterium]
MGNLLVPQRRQASPAFGRTVSAGWRSRRAAALCLVGSALAAFLAGGCAMNDGVNRVYEVSPAQFTTEVLRSEQPVLVNFYKPG